MSAAVRDAGAAVSAVRTPSPWNAQKAEGWRNWEIFASDAEETYVAGVNRDNESEAANAAFIVEACNAHDELVSALHEIEACTSLDSDANKIARAALRKVQP